MNQPGVEIIAEESTHTQTFLRPDLSERRLRRRSAFLILYLLFQAEFGLAWDRNWHDYLGRNQFWIPPHMMMYTGMGATGLAALIMVLVETIRYRQMRPGVDANSTVRVLRFFSAPLGFVILGFGTLVDLLAAPLDNYWHTLYGIDVTLWSPFHLMGMAGSILAGVGLLYAFASEAAIERQSERSSRRFLGLSGPEWGAVVFSAALIELSFIGLTAFKPITLGPWSLITYPLALVLVTGICLVSAVQLTRKTGTASLVALLFWALAFLVQLFVSLALHTSSVFFRLPFRGGYEPPFNVVFVILPLYFVLCASLLDGVFYRQCRLKGTKRGLQRAWLLGVLMAVPAVFLPSWITLILLHLAHGMSLPPDIFRAFILDSTWPAMLLILPFTLLMGAGSAALGSVLGGIWYWSRR